MPEATHVKSGTDLATLEYILNKFNLSFDDKTRLPIEIPDFGREQLTVLFKELGYMVGAEVGVHRGGYSELLCKNNPGVKLYGIDPYKAYDQYNNQQQVDEYYEEAKTRLAPYDYHFVEKSSEGGVKGFEDESLDFVYIDGNHEFSHVTADITLWSEKVKPGGIISGHDFIKFGNRHHQVVKAVVSYVQAYNIHPWFILGLNGKIPGMIRDHHRSWMWVKGKTVATNQSMLGKWDSWHKGVKSNYSFRYGNTVTYQLAADFLADVNEVEDWGCGTGGFKRLYKGKYIGIDGSVHPSVDKLVDLRRYRSSVEGIMMRHVLEHNYDWEKVLAGAVSSFIRKFCLVLFTPFTDTTQEITHNKKYGVDAPDIAFNRNDIERFFEGLKWRLQDNIKTNAYYGVEHIYYVEKTV
ncbi:hypothetical protein A2966_03575 [Candidatus Roizmanbacteria bacterium RIFCSPLOWO2_01_FULL_41_22]|uniref:Uncharacterized protein n=1 Tax=Candidatus Roizmanbacteria bacterium RIFCSPLOWO2_01_FULL_41_22 TaxID=1802067 RepID=A0A1F7JAF6_9BACT|nr:MAG: hypothetical protein A2966_03575 [Candidatus Roizmanbacteria bacterium RIFCSPLOWO2_01_FULL_41_22]